MVLIDIISLIQLNHELIKNAYYCAKNITEHIVDMVVRDLRPAATVEGSGFKVLINYVPSANLIAKVVRWKYLSCKSAIRSYLQSEAHYIAFTTDIWTSYANDTFHLPCILLMIVGVWFRLFLVTALFPEHHAAANIVS